MRVLFRCDSSSSIGLGHYREHFCDEIINHNISADFSNYKDLDIVKIIPPFIRDEFKKEKQNQKKMIYDIFITIPNSFAVSLAPTNGVKMKIGNLA